MQVRKKKSVARVRGCLDTRKLVPRLLKIACAIQECPRASMDAVALLDSINKQPWAVRDFVASKGGR